MTPEPPPRPTSRLRPATPRFRLGIGAAVIVAIVVLSVTVGIGLVRGQGALHPDEPLPVTTEAPGASRGGVPAPGAASVYVHVLGEVERPGLYVLGDGARVAEAVAAAGGTLASADLGSINLARPVSDGEQIMVAAPGAVAQAPGGVGGAPGAGGLIDLNTADAATLEELPRIGPALAARIIEWREQNGRFVAVDDLLAVPGIGEKLLAGLRDRVRV
ncbi:ComEA family DNA-binding protein [Microbacterium resistens]|uniref:ComEA family DNA-binding protein n=1 Tax=Microbacterium resistens TaxID=156977 RepID=UPI0020D1E37B|nr:ComEA family DNA-binding protein [Microbacterium resistens]